MSSTTREQIRLSKRLARLQPSATIGLIGRIGQMKAQGKPVISFGQGEPDFPTPIPIKVAAMEAIERNYTRYTPVGGIPELRRVIAQRVEQDMGIPYTINQVTVTCGVKEGLFLAFLAACDEGDEVIIPAPFWVSYIEQVRMAGAAPVVIATDESTRFKVTPEQLKACLTPRSRVLVLGSPSNPTGTVYSADELHALAEVLREHYRTAGRGLLVFSDEIYDRICYIDYARWLRVAPDFADVTVVFNGFSKTYAMTGWRVGYAAGPQRIIGAIKDMQSHSTTHPTSIAQYAALAAYTPSEELDTILAEMVQAFKERRDLMIAALEKIAGVTCVVPDGAFYVFPNVSGLLKRPLGDGTVCASSHELAEYLLERAMIGVVPGEAFGMGNYLRISYAQGTAALSEGMRRFAEAVS